MPKYCLTCYFVLHLCRRPHLRPPSAGAHHRAGQEPPLHQPGCGAAGPREGPLFGGAQGHGPGHQQGSDRRCVGVHWLVGAAQGMLRPCVAPAMTTRHEVGRLRRLCLPPLTACAPTCACTCTCRCRCSRGAQALRGGAAPEHCDWQRGAGGALGAQGGGPGPHRDDPHLQRHHHHALQGTCMCVCGGGGIGSGGLGVGVGRCPHHICKRSRGDPALVLSTQGSPAA